MSNNFYDTWQPTASRIARFVSYDFPDVEAADLEQDLYVEILERKWKDPDAAGVTIILRKVAKEKAAQYRAQHLMLSPQYNYRTSDVRKILERVFSYDTWIPHSSFAAVDDEGCAVPLERASEPTYDLDDTLAAFTDIKRAWERLPINYRKVVFEVYALGEELDSAGQKRLQRAVERLTDNLNSYHPRRNHEGPGSRRAISNAHARYILDNQWGDRHSAY